MANAPASRKETAHCGDEAPKYCINFANGGGRPRPSDVKIGDIIQRAPRGITIRRARSLRNPFILSFIPI
ncbi:hypothetical protein KCP73_21450 [Salmonella enterica subsp. enterica]|nr:hypothetical protein KCP73_21450 [Salmonella enterica subsp. enterica]